MERFAQFRRQFRSDFVVTVFTSGNLVGFQLHFEGVASHGTRLLAKMAQAA
jgi:hypothetical protein